jgi:hypothetical protein
MFSSGWISRCSRNVIAEGNLKRHGEGIKLGAKLAAKGS